MPVLTSERKKPKRSKIRYAEYYDLQKTLDSLYADSSKGKVFTHLMELISSKENIRMAYRTIKGDKYVVRSHMSDKAQKRAKDQLAKCIKAIQHPKSEQDQHRHIFRYNSIVIGMHNYYRAATCVNLDFSPIAFAIGKQMKNRLGKQGLSKQGKLEKGYIRSKYGNSSQIRFLKGHPLIPVGYIRHKNPLGRKRSINRYTENGREEIHRMLGVNVEILTWLMRNPRLGQSVEYADNRISLYAAQYGKCAVTGRTLIPHEIHCHHKRPKAAGGTDAYANLVIVSETVHQLVHATDEKTIFRLLQTLSLDTQQRKKLNKLREQANLNAI